MPNSLNHRTISNTPPRPDLAAVLAFYLARFLQAAGKLLGGDQRDHRDVFRRQPDSESFGVPPGRDSDRRDIGGAFAALFGQQLWAFGVAVTLTVLVCALLGFADAARLAGVAVAIVMLISHPGKPWIAGASPIPRSFLRDRDRRAGISPDLACRGNPDTA